MGHFLDRLTYFTRTREPFAGGHGEVRRENRAWEEGYRQRWQHDKIVRSTHGVNCTGSCSWKIYVKGGVVTWETQQTDYPRTRPDMPNHEPRGCSRGASYSWYLYSANRLKYPMVRGRLVRAWREARRTMDPVAAWASIAGDAETARAYKSLRGRGGFVRSSWDEVTEIIAAANIHTIKTYGPDRVVGFSPIPAMSMVSYASGARYLSLIGGTLLSFYDWYCDLPPSSPQTWGEQTDVPESADWYRSGFIIAWGSNIPQTRTPDAHFFVEARYNGTKVVAITPDYAEVAKLSDQWLHPRQGTDAARAMAMGHVILREFFLDRQVPYFQDYCRRYTDMPMLVRLVRRGERWVPDRYLRASDFPSRLGERSIINILMMCGTVGVSGGGWAHYVGQEKLRPQTGWTVLAFALDWVRPPRQMNGTSFFYTHSDQWRYEQLRVTDILSPLADPARYRGSLIDLNVRAERMGWLPSAPQLDRNPLRLAAEARAAGMDVADHVAARLKSGDLRMAAEDPDHPANF